MWLIADFLRKYGAAAAVTQRPVILILVFEWRRAGSCCMPIGWPWGDLFRSVNAVADMRVITIWLNAAFTICKSMQQWKAPFYCVKQRKRNLLWRDHAEYQFLCVVFFECVLMSVKWKGKTTAQPDVHCLPGKKYRKRGKEKEAATVLKGFLGEKLFWKWSPTLRHESAAILQQSVKPSPMQQYNHCLSF